MLCRCLLVSALCWLVPPVVVGGSSRVGLLAGGTALFRSVSVLSLSWPVLRVGGLLFVCLVGCACGFVSVVLGLLFCGSFVGLVSGIVS